MTVEDSSRIDEGVPPGRDMLAALLREGRPNTSRVDHIVEDIATQIILARLPPGADLNSVDLARRYASSRTPVREALLTLEREGLVEIPARRRPRVALVTLDQVRDIYQVRASLHGLVSELIVAEANDESLAVLAEWQSRLRADAERGDVDAYFWHNVGFRQAEAELTGNRQLTRTLGSLGLRTLQLRHLSLSFPGRLERSLDDHDRLMMAYADRDAALAVAITRSIINAGFRAIEDSGWPGLETGA
jgi:DNA-binding GntR family transcriptional regulator